MGNLRASDKRPYRELVADDKDSVWFAADTDPLVLLHLVHDDFLQASVAVLKDLGAHAPAKFVSPGKTCIERTGIRTYYDKGQQSC